MKAPWPKDRRGPRNDLTFFGRRPGIQSDPLRREEKMARSISLALAVAALSGCEAYPFILLNLELEVDNTGYSEEFFTVEADMNVDFQLRVLQGNAVDVRLCPREDPTSFKSAFSGNEIRERLAKGLLPKGKYVLRIRESTPREEKGAVKTATVRILLRGSLSRALRRG